jgi:hypothetical protein
MADPIPEQTMLQKKIALAQSDNAPIVIELMKDCIPQIPLVGDTEYKTLVNAITFDVQSTMIKTMVDILEDLRQGRGFPIK